MYASAWRIRWMLVGCTWTESTWTALWIRQITGRVHYLCSIKILMKSVNEEVTWMERSRRHSIMDDYLPTSRSCSATFRPELVRSSSSDQSWLCSRCERERRTSDRKLTAETWSRTCTVAGRDAPRNWCASSPCCHEHHIWNVKYTSINNRNAVNE